MLAFDKERDGKKRDGSYLFCDRKRNDRMRNDERYNMMDTYYRKDSRFIDITGVMMNERIHK